MEPRMPARALPSGDQHLAPSGRGAHGGRRAARKEPDEEAAKPVRVMVVDDHRAVRSAISAMLAVEPDVEVVAQAESGEQALELFARSRPDVVVMDVQMPGMDGIEATRRIRELDPEVRVIGLSMFDDEAVARRMAAAGAEVHLSKVRAADELLQAVRGRSSGEA
jgi:DNA-binding NarL/FixJ family response regulator